MKMFRFVLILTFIGSGISLFSSMMAPLTMPMMKELIESGQYPMPQEMQGVFDQIFAIPTYYYIVTALLYALSLSGAILMWRLNKRGFHLYTIAQLLLIVADVVILGSGFFNLGGVMITLFFVIYYYFTLRILTASPVEDTPSDNEALKEEEEDDEDDDEEDE